ncbi:hypothetical protein JCM11251_003226 [Rhodosporidiobolus azoricus]
MSFDSASSTSSPRAAWTHAATSPYSSPEASTSTSSLWTASSDSGSLDGRGRSSLDGCSDVEEPLQVLGSLEEDSSRDDEQSCLMLLEQLERERARVATRVRTGTPRQRGHKDDRNAQRAQEDVFGGYSLQNSPVGASPVAGPSTYQQTRRPQVYNAPKALLPSSSLASLQSMSTIRPSSSSASLSRSSRSRRISFTRTDIAELDIDAILDAYSHEVPFEEPVPPSSPRSHRAPSAPSTPSRNTLPRSKSTANLRNIRHDIFPAPPVPSPAPAPLRTFGAEAQSKMPSLTRTTTTDSTRSTKSASSNAYDELFPHRRVAPFPTTPRVKSSTSLRSLAKRSPGFDPSQAPPMPPLPLPLPLPPTTPRSSRVNGNRTFSSFARQSTCSTTSSSSSLVSSPPFLSSPHLRHQHQHHSQPQHPQQAHPFLRQSYHSSHYAPSFTSSASRISTTLSDGYGSSVRWSVATSSTAPSSIGAFSDTGDTCACSCSRRGSALFASPASPARRGSAPRFRLADVEPTEETEEEEEEGEDAEREDTLSSYAMSRRGTVESNISSAPSVPSPTTPAAADEEDDDRGLISWEDFASELDALAPPPSKSHHHHHQHAAVLPKHSNSNSNSRPFAPVARARVDSPITASASAASSSSSSSSSTTTTFPAPLKRPTVERSRTGHANAPSKSAMLRGKLSLATLRVR